MKKYLCIAALMISSSISVAQSDAVPSKRLHFGFLAGLDYNSLQTPRNLPDTVFVSNNLGMRLGLAANYRISDLLALSPQAEFSFSNARISRMETTSFTTWKVFPVSLDLRVNATFTDRSRKLEPYFLVGPAVKVPLSAHVNLQSNLNYNSAASVAFDMGIGVNKSFTQFHLQPELRYSIGLNNLSKTPGVSRMYFHTLSLLVKFLDK